MNTNNVCRNCSKCYIHIFILLTLYLFIITPKKTKTVFEHFVDIYKNDNACSSYSLDRNHMMCQYRGLYGGECDPNLNEKCMKDRHYIGVLVGRKSIMPVHRWFDTSDRKYKYVARRRNRKFVGIKLSLLMIIILKKVKLLNFMMILIITTMLDILMIIEK